MRHEAMESATSNPASNIGVGASTDGPRAQESSPDPTLNRGDGETPRAVQQVHDAIVDLGVRYADGELSDETFVARVRAATQTTAREKVHQAFKVRTAEGKCQCPYCTGDADMLAEMVGNYELDRYASEQRAEAAEAKLAALTAAGSSREEKDETHLLTGRLAGSIADYHNAPSGIGPLAAEWADKPHRLLYDALGEIRALRAAGSSAPPLASLPEEPATGWGEIEQLREALSWTLSLVDSLTVNLDGARYVGGGIELVGVGPRLDKYRALLERRHGPPPPSPIRETP